MNTKTRKYVVWMHQSKTVSTGTKGMPWFEAARLLKTEQKTIVKSNGCLPQWPKFEIRAVGNPPRTI